MRSPCKAQRRPLSAGCLSASNRGFKIVSRSELATGTMVASAVVDASDRHPILVVAAQLLSSPLFPTRGIALVDGIQMSPTAHRAV